MIVCPNKATQEWKTLVDKAGSSDLAYAVFVRNGYDLPSLKELENFELLIDKPIKVDKESVRKVLLNTGFFRGGPEGSLYAKKNYYGPALAAAKDYEAAIGFRGLITFVKEGFTGGTFKVVIREGQQELFDLPEGEQRPSLLIQGFKSFDQQKEVVDVIASSVLAFMRDNPDVKAGTFKKAIDNFESIIKPLAADNNIYAIILDNINQLSDQVKYKLQRLNLIAKPKLSGTNLEKKIITEETKQEEEGVEEVEAIGDFNDSWVFQYDSKDNALAQIKQFLAFIPKTVYDKEAQKFKLVQSIIPGQPSFMSYDEVYESLKAILAGVDNTWEAMEQQLKSYSISKPFIYSLFRNIEKYKGDIERLKSQFVSTMSSSYSGHKTILIKDKVSYDPTNGEFIPVGKIFNIIDTDQSSVQKVILNNWKADFKKGNFYTVKNGAYVINKQAIQSYLQLIDKVSKEPSKEDIRVLLNIVGISISEETLDTLFDGVMIMPIKNHFSDSAGLFTLIKKGLRGVEVDQIGDEDETLPIDPLDNSAVTALAKLESKNSDYYYSNTFRDVNNNTVYSYTFNKFLTKEFNKLKSSPEYVDDLLQITYNKPIKTGENNLYDTWLYKLSTNNIFRDSVFNISPLDGVKIAGNKTSGSKITDTTEFDQELIRLSLFTNSGISKRGAGQEGDSRIIQYLITIPSKSTSYIVQGTGVDTKMFFKPDNSYNFSVSNINALYAVFMTEYNRMVSQSKRTSDNRAYNTGSQKLFFFPTLLESIKNSDGTFKLPTDKLESGKTVEQDIKEKLSDILKKDVEQKVANWKRLGIVQENQLTLIDSNYINKVIQPLNLTEEQQIIYAAGDYVLNSILAKFNTHQLFIDDVAVYWKSNEKETWDNVGKRLSNLIAPFKEGRITEDNKTFISIKLNDFETSALNAAQLKGRIGKYYEDKGLKNPYGEESITGTDAQEYVTLREELAVMKMYGEIPTDLYNKLMKQLDTDPDNIVLNTEELDLIFTARKPVYSSRIISKEDDTVYREYIKTASIVLLPQFTKGLEIDKLRVAMEKIETSGKYKGKTVRAVFKSGTKLGGKKFASIWNKDGTIKDDLDLTENVIELDRSNFGIQQEVPYDEKKNEVVRSSQVLKLLFDSLDDVENFRYNGKYYTGKQLKEIYSNLIKQVYESGLASLESRILVNGLLNIPKVTKLLNEEGLKRGYSPAQLSFLETNPEGTDFVLPFWAHVNNDKEQSMLMSLWTNNVLKQKMPGGSYVLVSEEGMQGRSIGVTYVGTNKTEVVERTSDELLTQDLPQEAEDSIVSVSATDPEEGSYIEEVKAGEAVKNLKSYINKLDDLIKCLNA